MQFKPKKLGITQLSPDLFVLAHKINHEMFRNSPSIPEPARWAGNARLVATGVPPLILSTEFSWGLLEVIDEV